MINDECLARRSELNSWLPVRQRLKKPSRPSISSHTMSGSSSLIGIIGADLGTRLTMKNVSFNFSNVTSSLSHRSSFPFTNDCFPFLPPLFPLPFLLPFDFDFDPFFRPFLTAAASSFFRLLGFDFFEGVFHLTRPVVAFKVRNLPCVRNVLIANPLAHVHPAGDATSLLGFVQHIFVPLLEQFWLWDLLILRVAVKDVVVALAWRARPNVRVTVPYAFTVVEVGHQKLLVDQRPEVFWPIVIDRIEVRDIHAAPVRLRAV